MATGLQSLQNLLLRALAPNFEPSRRLWRTLFSPKAIRDAAGVLGTALVPAQGLRGLLQTGGLLGLARFLRGYLGSLQAQARRARGRRRHGSAVRTAPRPKW